MPHHPSIKAEYERIGQERHEAGKLADRDKLWWVVRTLVWCWLWSLAGIALILMSSHVRGQIGFIELPRQMLLAKSYFWGGLVVGTAGSLGTLIINWRKALDRGLFD